MENFVKKQIKYLLVDGDITNKELAKMLSEKTQKKYTPDGFSHKLSRGSILYNEMVTIADILGYDIKFVRRENELDKM